MKETKIMKCGGFYLLESRSSANSCYFQNAKEARRFFSYFNYYMKELITIYDYLLLEDGWFMVVKLMDCEKFDEYLNGAGDESIQAIELWRIISERIRLALSNYVPAINRMRGRTGSLVHSSYHRYYFERKGEAIEMLKRIRAGRMTSIQRRKRYRPKAKRYYRLTKLGKGCLLLSSREARKVDSGGGVPVESFYFQAITEVVVANFVDITVQAHNSS